MIVILSACEIRVCNNKQYNILLKQYSLRIFVIVANKTVLRRKVSDSDSDTESDSKCFLKFIELSRVYNSVNSTSL